MWGAVAPVPFVIGGFQCDSDVVSEQVDDVSLGRVGDRHETLRMLRNHHAHPPTRIPRTARMCMPGPGLVGEVGTRALPERQGPTMLNYSLPKGLAVSAPCGMVIEK